MYTQPQRRRRRAALAALDPRRRRRPTRANARPGRRGLPVAHDPRRGVLRATGPPAPPPSTSTPTSPTPCCATSRPPATTTSSARSASSCSSRPRGCGARSATTTREASFRIDGVTGPDEYSAVADNNVYTNLMAQRNLRGAADAVRAPPARGRALGVELGGDRGLARRRRPRWSSPTTRSSASTPQAEGFTAPRDLGLRAHARGAIPAAAALPLLRPLPQAGRQAGRPRAGDGPVRPTRSPPEQKAAQLRLLRADHRARLVAVARAPRP